MTTIPTWSCDNCGYKQDFEPTEENMALHFPGGQHDACPSCGAHLGVTPEEREEQKVVVDDGDVKPNDKE